MLTITPDTFGADHVANTVPIPNDGRRRRRYHTPGPLLTEQHFRTDTRDGADVVWMKLHARGHGREVLLDAADWPLVRDLKVPAWTLAGHTRKHVGYVCSGTAAVRHLAAGGRAAYPLVVLARVLTGAARDQNVRYRNKDTLDLRRENLVVVGRKQFLAELGMTPNAAAVA